MFFHELSADEETLRSELLIPLLRYQQELVSSGSQVFAIAERFQCKLLSTGKTFPEHRDWGGDVALVGEFDQIRLRKIGDARAWGGRPAIIEFKTGLGKRKSWDIPSAMLKSKGVSTSSNELTQPGMIHAFQLAIYWLAFQTRWDVLEQMLIAKGRGEHVRMSFQQDLDLILYNLHDGCQYQLLFTDAPKALQALTNCIFYLNWAMKNGYAKQTSEHACRKTALLQEVPIRLVQVGHTSISSEECYLLAQIAFDIFKEAVRWRKLVGEAREVDC